MGEKSRMLSPTHIQKKEKKSFLEDCLKVCIHVSLYYNAHWDQRIEASFNRKWFFPLLLFPSCPNKLNKYRNNKDFHSVDLSWSIFWARDNFHWWHFLGNGSVCIGKEHSVAFRLVQHHLLPMLKKKLVEGELLT